MGTQLFVVYLMMLSVTNYIASNDCITISNKLKRIWNDNFLKRPSTITKSSALSKMGALQKGKRSRSHLTETCATCWTLPKVIQ
jgi:hypothetical protein